MSPTDESLPPVEALGGGLLVIGLTGTVFGLAALTWFDDVVELAFFGIDLNHTTGRVIGSVACLSALVAGILVLRLRGRSA